LVLQGGSEDRELKGRKIAIKRDESWTYRKTCAERTLL